MTQQPPSLLSSSLTALDEGVPDVVPDAAADGAVLRDAALGVDAAPGVPTRVAALVVNAERDETNCEFFSVFCLFLVLDVEVTDYSLRVLLYCCCIVVRKKYSKNKFLKRNFNGKERSNPSNVIWHTII